jgi:hypothetical protein
MRVLPCWLKLIGGGVLVLGATRLLAKGRKGRPYEH